MFKLKGARMTISQLTMPLQGHTKKGIKLAGTYLHKLIHLVDRLYFADEYESLQLKPPRPVAIHRALKKRTARKNLLKLKE